MGVGLFAVKRPHDLQWVKKGNYSGYTKDTFNWPLQFNEIFGASLLPETPADDTKTATISGYL